MPFGTFNAPATARLKVGLTTPPATLLGGLQRATLRMQKTTTTDKFMNGQASDASNGPPEYTWDLNGRSSSGDSGLAVLKAAADDPTDPTVYVSGSLEGTKGDIVGGRISNMEITLEAENKSSYSFQLTGSTDLAELAGGGIFD